MSHPRPLLVYSFFSKDKQTSAGFELRLLEQKTSTMTTTTAHLSMLGDLSDSGLPTSDKIRCITLTTGFFGSKFELQARREIQAIFLFLYLTIFPSQARQKTLSHSGLAMTRGKKIHCLLITQIKHSRCIRNQQFELKSSPYRWVAAKQSKLGHNGKPYLELTDKWPRNEGRRYLLFE